MACKSLETGEAEGACACSLEQGRHPSGNIFPPVCGIQCTDSRNITVVFFAIELLAHSCQKSIVKLPELSWGWIRHQRKWWAGGSAGAGICMDLSFQFSMGMCFCSFSCDFQQDLWDRCEQSYLVLMQILFIDRAEDILFVIFHTKTFHGGEGKRQIVCYLPGHGIFMKMWHEFVLFWEEETCF